MPTENRGYNTPAQGSEDWHVPLNENFENIDTDVLIRDTEVNLGNYTPKTGGAFLAIDTGKVFLGDGAAWLDFGYLSPVPIIVQDTEPTDPEDGTVWISTS